MHALHSNPNSTMCSQAPFSGGEFPALIGLKLIIDISLFHTF